MREDSNRMIAGMEQRRRAEKADRERVLAAMGDNARRSEQRMEENFRIEQQNLKNEAYQEIANIQGAQKQAQTDAAAQQSIVDSLLGFSQTLEKESARRTADMIRDQTTVGLSTPAQVISAEDVEQNAAARAAQFAGAIKLDTDHTVDGVLNNDPPDKTVKGYISNHGFTGVAARVNDNKVAEETYYRVLNKRLSDGERTFITASGREFTGMQALGDRELMEELHRQTLKDVSNYMGFTDPLYLATANKNIAASNKALLNQAGTEFVKRAVAVMKQQALDIASEGTVEGVTLGFARMKTAVGNAAAHDWYVENVLGNPDIPEEVAKAPDFMNTGKSYSEQWPARYDEGIKKRNAAIVKQQNAEEDLKKAQDAEWVNTNIDSIIAAYNENPVQAALFIKQRYNSLAMTPPAVITAIEREAIKQKKDILESLIAQKTKFGNLDLPFVNSIADATLQKAARTAYEDQELRKYGPEGVDIKKGMMATARGLTGFDVNAKGASSTTYMVHTAIYKRYLENVSKYSSPTAAWTATKEQIANDKSNPEGLFYQDPKGLVNNKPYFPNIETTPIERTEMNVYIDKKMLREGRNFADKPFSLANQDEMDATYTSYISGGNVQYPPGIIRFADSTGLKPSKVFNAQRIANNAVTGGNKPLLVDSPLVETIDNAGPALRKLISSDVREQVNRGKAMMTGNLPVRSSMVQSTGVRGLADLVSSGEGGPTSMFPGENYPEMGDMSIREVVEFQKEKLRDGRASAAVGSYQFLYPEQAAQRAGLSLDDKFTPENQLKMFMGTLLNKPGRENLSTFLQGTGDDIEAAIDELAQEFASIEYRDGRSYYNDGVNKASISRDQVRAALISAREEFTTQ